MKRLRIMVSVLTVAVLLVGLVSCAKPLPSGSESAPPVIPELSNEDLLPDLPIADESDGSWVQYKSVTPEQLDEYVRHLEGKGFTCRREMYDISLWREDAFISISNNTVAYSKFSVKIYRQRKTENGLSADEAKAIINDDRVSILIEQSPEGFCEKTGAQFFLAPMDRSVDKVPDYPENRGMVVKCYLVTPKDSLFINDIDVAPVAADMDDDGIHEIVWIGNGFTSGRFTFSLCVYHVQDGMIQEKAFAYYESDAYRMSLRADGNGQVWLDYRKRTDEQTNSTTVTIEDNIVRIDDGEHFEFLHANKFQR